MKTATVGDIQKNFGRILKQIKAGEEIVVTRRGKPVAIITALGPKEEYSRAASAWLKINNEAIPL